MHSQKAGFGPALFVQAWVHEVLCFFFFSACCSPIAGLSILPWPLIKFSARGWGYCCTTGSRGFLISPGSWLFITAARIAAGFYLSLGFVTYLALVTVPPPRVIPGPFRPSPTYFLYSPHHANYTAWTRPQKSQLHCALRIFCQRFNLFLAV